MNESQEKRMLYESASQFRMAIEQIIKEQAVPSSIKSLFEKFPRGACGNTSELLAYYFLKEKNTQVFINTNGYYKKRSHEWIEYQDKYIIDITSDQFEGREGKSVVVTNKNDAWYKKFCKNRIILFSGEFPKMFRSDLHKFYEIIVNRIE